MDNQHKARLNGLINQFLNQELNFEEFQSDYSNYFIDQLPEGSLDSADYEFFAAVHEQAEWAAPNPPPEDRQYGWRSIGEFTEWLRERPR